MKVFKFSTRNISLITIFFGVMFMMFYYRRGGVVDSIYSSAPGFRDVGIFIRAAQDILAQRNPYASSDLSFRSGSFGVLPFALLGFGSLGFLLAQILNLLGFAFFVNALLGSKIGSNGLLLLFSVGLWFSCLREVFSTGQISGILAGLCAIGFKFLSSESIVKSNLAAFSFALVLDLKPNLFIFFTLLCYMFYGKLRMSWKPFVMLLIGHLVVDIYTNLFLELNWYRVLRAVNSSSADPQNLGTKTFWSVATYLFHLKAIPNVMTLICFIGLGTWLLVLMRENRNINLISLSLSTPFFYNYFYLYSLTSAALLALGVCVAIKSPTLIGLSLPFLLVSGPNFGLFQLLLSVVIGAYLVIMLNFSGLLSGTPNLLKKFMFSFIFSIAVRLGLEVVIKNDYFLQAFVLDILVGLFIFVHLKDFFKYKSFKE